MSYLFLKTKHDNYQFKFSKKSSNFLNLPCQQLTHLGFLICVRKLNQYPIYKSFLQKSLLKLYFLRLAVEVKDYYTLFMIFFKIKY